MLAPNGENMRPLLRGIFLTSDKPEETAEFYRAIAGMELEKVGSAESYVYWKMDKGGVQLAIHDAAKFAEYTHPTVSESNLTHLYFKIDDQKKFLDRLDELRITLYLKDDIVITIVDPDGRKVMFGTA